MLHKNEGHAAAGGQRLHELAASIEAARRGADSDDREVPTFARRAMIGQVLPARTRPAGAGLPTAP